MPPISVFEVDGGNLCRKTSLRPQPLALTVVLSNFYVEWAVAV